MYNIKTMQIILNVPYHSQFIEVNDSFWNIRSCGGACIKMIFDFYKIEYKSILEIMKEIERNGGYDLIYGTRHDALVNLLKENGLESYRGENLDFNLLIKSIENNNPVIVSINKITLEQKKSHLILIVGVEKDEIGNIINIIYHESESTNIERGKFRKVDLETFLKYWRGMAIFVSKK